MVVYCKVVNISWKYNLGAVLQLDLKEIRPRNVGARVISVTLRGYMVSLFFSYHSFLLWVLFPAHLSPRQLPLLVVLAVPYI